ncbi:hypothetical protein PIB30_072632 [Stylosanthes scabra]|uniref:Uncharacterized protein n=1 Tax=Stylosanthes scabra TaxID=79078 RepID=A0ABU6SQC2_9FABA|nr:hypothetical protein [Stylosanthes scabra]
MDWFDPLGLQGSAVPESTNSSGHCNQVAGDANTPPTEVQPEAVVDDVNLDLTMDVAREHEGAGEVSATAINSIKREMMLMFFEFTKGITLYDRKELEFPNSNLNQNVFNTQHEERAMGLLISVASSRRGKFTQQQFITALGHSGGLDARSILANGYLVQLLYMVQRRDDGRGWPQMLPCNDPHPTFPLSVPVQAPDQNPVGMESQGVIAMSDPQNGAAAAITSFTRATRERLLLIAVSMFPRS